MKTYKALLNLDVRLVKREGRITCLFFFDAENQLEANEEKFRKGLVSFDEYSENRTRNVEVQIALSLAEAAYKNARVNLEGLVGTNLDEYLS